MGKPESGPLLEALLHNHEIGAVPFHMPGHKKGRGVLPEFARLMAAIPFSLDMTEIPGLDDLHNPTGPIKEAQIEAARLFGADRTLFMVNGSTGGIHTAITALCKQDEEILLPRELHLSVMGACIISGARPRYLTPRIDPDFLVPYPSTALEVSEALVKNPAVKAVFQVYPSYYGLAGDLGAVVKAAHEREIPVITDEAHGSHFAFSRELPPAAMALGADISVQSTHKTLGALTQAAMMHLRGGFFDMGKVVRQAGLLQTTSPSYLLMASLDAAVTHMALRGQALMDDTVALAKRARGLISQIRGLRCLGDRPLESQGVAACDHTKLYISVKDTGLTGYKFADELSRHHGIQVELADRYNVLCMVSIGTTSADTEKLIAGLKSIAAQSGGARQPVLPSEGIGISELPEMAMTPRQAWFAEQKPVSLELAAGEIAAEIAAPYPPGIPLICPGEVVTTEIIRLIKVLKEAGAAFHGPADPDLNQLNVVKCRS